MKQPDIKHIIKEFIKATNAFDVKAALTLFAGNAVIDDVSVGKQFKKTAGVRNYLEKFFVAYHTVTKLESIELFNDLQAKAFVDFTGDFGHETGGLTVTISNNGLIIKIDAHLD